MGLSPAATLDVSAVTLRMRSSPLAIGHLPQQGTDAGVDALEVSTGRGPEEVPPGAEERVELLGGPTTDDVATAGPGPRDVRPPAPAATAVLRPLDEEGRQAALSHGDGHSGRGGTHRHRRPDDAARAPYGGRPATHVGGHRGDDLPDLRGHRVINLPGPQGHLPGERVEAEDLDGSAHALTSSGHDSSSDGGAGTRSWRYVAITSGPSCSRSDGRVPRR